MVWLWLRKGADVPIRTERGVGAVAPGWVFLVQEEMEKPEMQETHWQ